MNAYTDPNGDRWTVYQADFRDTLRLVAEGGGCDLVAFSPPYCDARTYGAGVSWGMEEYSALGDAVFAALKPGGHALVNVDAPVREWRKGFGTERGFHPWKMMIDWAERVGFRVPDRLAFGRRGVPGDTVGRFQNGWEPLLWFQRPGGETFLDKRAIATKEGVVGTRKSGGRQQENGRCMITVDVTTDGTVLPNTLWNYGGAGAGQSGAPDIEAENHPARWPYKLAEDIVRCFCPVGGLVCDPFSGAGTTGAAAIANGRRFVGGDLFANEHGEPWAAVTQRVLVARTRQVKLFGGGE